MGAAASTQCPRVKRVVIFDQNLTSGKEFHVNRLHESPLITDDSDDYKTEAKIFLNDGEDCDGHKNCGRNRRGSKD